MNPIANNGNNANNGNANNVNGSKEAAAERTLQDVDRAYFPPSRLADGAKAAEEAVALATKAGGKIVYNFDPTNGEFPAGYGLAIIPITQRDKAGEKGNVVIGVAIAAIPEPATIAAEEGGESWLYDALIATLLARVANAVRPRGETGATAGVIPFSVADFIVGQRATESLEAWRSLSPRIVKSLRAKGLRSITQAILRQVLQSAEFAGTMFPKISQDVWRGVLELMVRDAGKANLEPGILTHWLETREQAGVEVPELSMDDLAGLGDEGEGEGENAAS